VWSSAGGLGAGNGRVDAQLDARGFRGELCEEGAQRGEFGGGGFAAGDGIDFDKEAWVRVRAVGEAVIFPALGRVGLVGRTERGAAGEHKYEQRERDEGGCAKREAAG